MKKLYTLFVAVFLLAATQAWGYTVKFDFDEASRIEFRINNQEIEITSGINTFEMARYSKFEIKARRGCALISVTDKAGVPFRIIDGLCSELVYPDADGNTYSVVTVDLDEARTASCYVTLVGDPELVAARLPGTASRVFFTEGRQTLHYSPEYEPELSLSSLGDAPLYKVTVDGKDADAGWGCTVALKPGCEIVINQAVPQHDVTVRFTFTSTAVGCIDVVNINKDDVALGEDNAVVCRPGDEMAVYIKDSYRLLGVKVDGRPLTSGISDSYFYYSVKDDAVIEIDARPYGDIPFTVNIDNPDAVSLYRGYVNPDYQISLVAGINNVGVPELDPRLIVRLNSGYYFKSFTDRAGNDYAGIEEIKVNDGLALNIATAPIVVDCKAALYVDDISMASYFFELLNSYDEEIDVATGYNIIDFGVQHNPFELSWYAPVKIGSVYLNNGSVEPESPNTTTFPVTLADGDVLKVYLAGEPLLHEVKFDVEDGLAPEVTADVITPVTDFTAPLQCFSGTLIGISAPGLQVTANGTPLDGESFTVDGDTRIEISRNSDGIAGIETDARPAPVYNMQGVCVGTTGRLSSLPAGIYIVNGKKISIRF